MKNLAFQIPKSTVSINFIQLTTSFAHQKLCRYNYIEINLLHRGTIDLYKYLYICILLVNHTLAAPTHYIQF